MTKPKKKPTKPNAEMLRLLERVAELLERVDCQSREIGGLVKWARGVDLILSANAESHRSDIRSLAERATAAERVLQDHAQVHRNFAVLAEKNSSMANATDIVVGKLSEAVRRNFNDAESRFGAVTQSLNALDRRMNEKEIDNLEPGTPRIVGIRALLIRFLGGKV